VTSLAWVVVVPVKTAALGKSRLAEVLADDERADLVRAMALDTIAAARAAAGVRRVVVVTADEPLRRALAAQAGGPVTFVDEPAASADPLNAALRAGADEAHRLEPDCGVAALLGDLPALRPDELAAALRGAGTGAFVPDAAGSGTTLVAAGPGATFDPHFGRESAAAHAEVGYAELPLPASSTLRRDVDVPGDLRAVDVLGAGPRTAAWLDRAKSVERRA
jgi:2-phospho-L-lactate/phosphoenolpyruvate guanylyltransferase